MNGLLGACWVIIIFHEYYLNAWLQKVYYFIPIKGILVICSLDKAWHTLPSEYASEALVPCALRMVHAQETLVLKSEVFTSPYLIQEPTVASLPWLCD